MMPDEGYDVMNRRTFTKELLVSVSSYAFVSSLFYSNAFAHSVRPLTDHWVYRLNQYCGDLKKKTISPSEWQRHVEELFATIELNELLRFIDFDVLLKGFTLPDLGVNTRNIVFPKLAGLPEKTVFVKKIFGMKKDRAIIPHGHSNMASAHLVLKGDMQLRHYNKLHQDNTHLIIQPTIDTSVQAGNYSSISDERDNVHWFVATSEAAYTLDVIVLDLNKKSYDIHNIDMYEKEDLHDGTLRVPLLDVTTALKKYGKTSHH